MCDTSDYAVGVVLGLRIGKNLHVIIYASRMLDGAQYNYHTTKKETFVVVFSWKIQVKSTWYKSHYFCWPYNFKVSFKEKEVETKID